LSSLWGFGQPVKFAVPCASPFNCEQVGVFRDREEGALSRMNYRTLGRTGLHVSEIGYGAWGIGKGLWIGASDDESVRALNKAFDLGLNFVDTALVYGDGRSPVSGM
jgi:hypothetical protein